MHWISQPARRSIALACPTAYRFCHKAKQICTFHTLTAEYNITAYSRIFLLAQSGKN